MAANRRKTIEYAFGTRITPLPTGTTLDSASRHDAAALTLFIPETVSRRFLSVRLVASYRTQYAATNGITGWRMGVKLGTAATSDFDRTFAAINTASKNVFDVVDLDVTDYFQGNFGAAGSQSCVASLAVATTTAANINSITLKLVITYEFDATAQPTRIKTIRIPIQSQAAALTAAHQEIGTDGTGAAPAKQIPALDTFLPEAGKVYRQIFLESSANEHVTAAAAAFTPFLQIDGTAEVARATMDQTLGTPLVWRDHYDLTGVLATSTSHALKMRCDVTSRMVFASSTLVVTYEYDAATTAAVLCEAMIPLTMSNDDTLGMAQGESFSANVAADAQALIATLSVQEANPVLAQSAVYLTCQSYNSSGAIQVRAAGQPYRPYTSAATLAEFPIVHRVDHGSGWTLARGDNRLVLNVYNTLAARTDLAGYALIHYRAVAPNDPDAATHVVNYAACTYGATPANAISVAAASSSLRVPVLGAPYRLQGVLVEQYCRITQASLFNQLLLEQRAGEWDAAGFIATPYRHGGAQQVGSWRVIWPLTKSFNLDHLHTGRLDIEGARRQVAWCGSAAFQASWTWWITYHQLSFSVAGKVTIAGRPVDNGKPVEIYARDAQHRTEYIAAATTASGTGAFSITVVDSTRTYFASYQDGTLVGRSSDGTPGAGVFDVAIPGPPGGGAGGGGGGGVGGGGGSDDPGPPIVVAPGPARGRRRYIDHLPAVFQDDPFLARFLLAFERVLSGLPDPDPANLPSAAPGIEQILDRIQTYFDPAITPPDFLPWLASWVATSLREDWDAATRRRFLAHVVPLYQRRGTKRALQQLLQIYLNPAADPQRDAEQNLRIIDNDPAFPPRYFLVEFTVVEHDPQVLARRTAIATAIIDREKPAHTFYGLRIHYPALKIADPPTFANNQPVTGVFVGTNTILGIGASAS